MADCERRRRAPGAGPGSQVTPEIERAEVSRSGISALLSTGYSLASQPCLRHPPSPYADSLKLPEKILLDNPRQEYTLVDMEVQTMEKEQYTNRKGAERWRPLLTLDELESLMMDGDLLGWCLGCGEEQRSEPDAEKQVCESCKQALVYGVEQLVQMGVALVDGEVAR